MFYLARFSARMVQKHGRCQSMYGEVDSRNIYIYIYIYMCIHVSVFCLFIHAFSYSIATAHSAGPGYGLYVVSDML